jgi:putative transposase
MQWVKDGDRILSSVLPNQKGMQYRRAKTPGATYFFTLVTHHRRPILGESENIDLLREAFRYVMKQHPFK